MYHFHSILVLLVLLKSSSSARQKQSNECTTEEIDNNIQCFQEIPKPVYEVTEGSATTLRCIVRNQHGKVQWRAVPVLLGYDRNIPGRPRYRIVGSVVRGEHFLEIRGVKVKDAGIYECQVQPVGQLHPLLRRKTKLVVLVRPTKPEIYYRSVKPINKQIIINSINQEVRSVFTCFSDKGQPKVTYQWFLNNEPLKNGQKSALIETVNDFKSNLSLLTTQLKDGDVIRCRVSNRATEVHQDPESRYLQIDLFVVIHNPPGQPQISDMTKSRDSTFVDGDVIRATCSSSPPGKPAGSLLWRWKFPKIRELFNNQMENFTVNDISPQYYQQSISRNQLVSKIELPPLTSRYHGAQLFCVASNPVISYQSVAVKFYVKYPPSEVVISVSDGSMMTRNIGTEGLTETVIFGEAGEQKTLTCTTASYYNEAMVKWQIHQGISTNEVFIKKFPLNPVEKVWKEDEGFRRNSTIKVTIDKQLDKSFLDCQAWSLGKRVDSRVKLDITYPPEKPVISGYHSERPVKLNHVVELTCLSVGGNPFPNLQWFRENIPIQSTFNAEQVGNQKSLKINIYPSISDNNAKYFCQAKSVALKNAPLKSDEITLSVIFPPSAIDLKSLSGDKIESGHVLILQCTAGESNPAAVVKWKISRCGQMMSELGRRPIQTTCNDEALTTASQKIILGKYGGSTVNSNLEMRTSWRDHLDYIDCEIHNAEYGEEYQVLRKRIQVNVTFPPQFEGIVNRHFVVEEGHSQTINLEPISNPPVKQYKWIMGSNQLEQNFKKESIEANKAKLIITKANPLDMGNYTVVAINDRGESKFTIFLNVTYQPMVIGDKFETVVNNRQNTDLECSAKANPTNPYLSFKWIKLVPKKGYEDFSNTDLVPAFTLGCNNGKWKGTPEKSNLKYFSKCNTKSQFEMTNLLIVYDVDRNDVGLYKCIINNGIGGDVVKTVELIKDFTPQILVLPKFSKAAGTQGHSISLFCYIRAEPEPTMIWYFGRYNSTISASSKYRINLTRFRPGFYISQLMISDLRRSDYGNYFCKAENVKGSDSRKVEVSGTSVPDTPLDVQVINRSINSIEISWVQGFDGGSTQTFQVRWKVKSSSSLYRYEDVASDDSRTSLTFTITGLKTNTAYDISINSRNPKHGKSEFSKPLIASTNSANGEFETINPTFPIPSNYKLQDNTILFIVAASVFGFVILVVNVLVIIFVLRRKRLRSRTAKLEAKYNNPKSLLAASNGLILSRDDSMKDSNFNYYRSDMVELYPRGLNSSQIQHPHHIHSLRRSIPDDQKTFSSFETGSDDARDDLLRKQKEFGCNSIDQSSLPRSIIVTYDPVTNASYYTPVSAGSQTPILFQHGMYDQDTLSTILSPIHEGNQKHLMTFMNMIPMNDQRNSSSCSSVQSAGNYSNNAQKLAHKISPRSSIVESDSNNHYSNHSDNENIHSTVFNNQNLTTDFNSYNNISNLSPYRTKMVSPSLMSYNIAPQHREAYATELRNAQHSGNTLVNPAMFNRQHSTSSPHNIIGSSPLIPQMINSLGQSLTMPMSFENMSTNCNNMNSFGGTTKSSDSHIDSAHVPITFDGKISQKYRCVDNNMNSSNKTGDRSIEFVNPAMEDSINLSHHSDSQYLPRPNII